MLFSCSVEYRANVSGPLFGQFLSRRRSPGPDPFLFSPVHYRKQALRLDPDVRGYVASRVAHLVGASGSGGFLTEVHVEVLVDLHAAVLRVAVYLEQVGTFLGHLGVELVVPAAIERVGNVEPPAVERELEHLWTALELTTRDLLALTEQPAAPDLAGETRVGGIAYVVLAEVAVQPV